MGLEPDFSIDDKRWVMPTNAFVKGLLAASLAGIVVMPPASAHEQSSRVTELLAGPIRAERQQPVTIVPVRRHMGKLAIDASVNGVERQFIFDTGSPTIISRSFADELDLEVVGSNVGADANGTPVRMEIAIVSRLTIGDSTFFDVPVMIHDFDALDLGPCFFDGGLIGSEIFPGQAWRVDLQAQTLEIASDSASFARGDGVKDAIEASLHDYGYPHAPIVDYAVGKMQDKALVDTGNSEALSLYAEALRSADVRDAIVAGTQHKGRGSHGTSSGGHGEVGDLARMTLDGVRLGEDPVGTIEALIRPVPPSLFGLGLMKNHRVTLDYPNGVARFERTAGDDPTSDRAGFAVASRGENFEVVQLYAGSRADTSGLRLGDHVLAIDEHALDASDRQARCETTRWLTGGDHVDNAHTVTVARDGEAMPMTLRPSAN